MYLPYFSPFWYSHVIKLPCVSQHGCTGGDKGAPTMAGPLKPIGDITTLGSTSHCQSDFLSSAAAAS